MNCSTILVVLQVGRPRRQMGWPCKTECNRSTAQYFQKQITKVNPNILTIEVKKVELAIKEIFRKISSIQNKKITILFSPAAASFDQFNNFEHRGEHFKKLIFKALKKMDLKC